MTWHHQLDYLGDPISDSMPLQRNGGLLIEAGSLKWAGLAIPFRQEWRRLSHPSDESSAEISPGRIRITIGPWRILIVDNRPEGPFRASMFTLSDGKWLMSGMLTEPAETGSKPRVRADSVADNYGPGRQFLSSRTFIE
jgi:hypothetical protein